MDAPPDRHYDLFVSYAAADRAWVKGYLLPAAGVPEEQIITPDAFRPGASKVAEFERAVTFSRSTVLILSPAYLADEWAIFGDQLASHAAAAGPAGLLVPLLLTECSLPLRIEFRVRLDCTIESNWDGEIARLRALLSSPEPADTPVPCPYPGMLPFSAQNAGRFFGRDEEIEAILLRLRGQGLLLVIGNSGAGKSSLVSAGVLPNLVSTSLFPPGYWLVRRMRPGDEPCRQLTELIGDITNPVRSADRLLDANTPAARLLLFIDQFEEIFSLADATERQLFLAVLRDLRNNSSRCTILITMRAAFYQDLMSSDLWPITDAERFEVVPLRGDALRAAIQKPAFDVGVYLEPALVDRLLQDGANEPGVLPLMQETLVLVWSRPKRRLLALSSYERLGSPGQTGLAAAIAIRADAVLLELTPRRRSIARRVFLRLVQFGEGRPDTRRQQRRGALRSAGEDPLEFHQTIDHLIDHHLLISSGRERGDNEQIDIAHESLIIGWPALQMWLSERRAAEQTRRRLEEKGEEWIRLGGGNGGLLDPIEMAEAERWLNGADAAELGHSAGLDRLIAASRQAVERAEREKEESRLRELAHQQALAEEQRKLAMEQSRRAAEQARQAKRFRRLSTGLAVIGLVALIASGYAAWLRTLAQARELAAASRANEASDPELSILLAAHSIADTWRWAHTVLPESEEQLHRSLLASHLRLVLRGHQEGLRAVAWSPDGKRLATASNDHTARVWDAAGGKEILVLRGHVENVKTIAWSPDGKRLATGSHDQSVKIWDAASGAELRTLTGFQELVEGVAWSPDSKRLAAVGTGGENRIADADTGKTVLTLRAPTGRAKESDNEDEDDINGVAWSPDGKHIATAHSDNTARIWDAATGRETATIRGHTGEVLAVAWSPKGERLATVSGDQTAKIWSADGRLMTSLQGHQSTVTAVAWAPDGNRLATAGFDQTAKVWEISSGRAVLTMDGHRDAIHGIAWSPEGSRLATAGLDGTARIWDAQGSWELFRLSGHRDSVTSVAWSPDSRYVASGSQDKTAKVWDAHTGRLVTTLTGHEGVVLAVSWSPDGKRLATGSNDSSIKIWDFAAGKEAFTLIGHGNTVKTVQWSPDGKFLASGSVDQTIKIWDLTARHEVMTLKGHTNTVDLVAWSPDGRRLASASRDNTAKVWRADNGAVLFTMSHADSVEGLAWSPNGSRLATASRDDRASLWDANNGKLILPLFGHGRPVWSVTWSPLGNRLATGGFDGLCKIWDSASGRELATLSASRGEIASVAWSPDGKYLASGNWDSTIQVYSMDLHDLMALARQRVSAQPSSEGCKKYLRVEVCPAVPEL